MSGCGLTKATAGFGTIGVTVGSSWLMSVGVGLVANGVSAKSGFGKGNVFDLPCPHISSGDGVGHWHGDAR